MTPAESNVPHDTATFEEFYRAGEPRIRRALVAACGPHAGIEAAAAAMQYGFERWDSVRDMDNPAGYLYRVGRNAARSRRKRRRGVERRRPESGASVHGPTTAVVGTDAGALRNGIVWTSRGSGDWTREQLGEAGMALRAVAADRRGYVVAGAELAGDLEAAETAVGWYSHDGMTWRPVEVENAWGSQILDVVPFADG